MKKASCLIFILSLVCLMCACSKQITVEQTAKNIAVYEKDIKSCLEEYQYVLEDTTQEHFDSFSQEVTNNDNYFLRQYTINIDDETKIIINISNDSFDETYQVVYTTAISDADSNTSNINKGLFSKLINAVADKEITEKYLNKLMSEKKYDHDFIDRDHKKYKIDKARFGKYWFARYELTIDNKERIEFYGASRQLED